MALRFFKKNANFDFLGKQKLFIAISLFLIMLSLISLFTRGLNYGIDFAGGVELQLRFKEDKGIGFVRDTLKEIGYSESSVQKFGDVHEKEYLILFRSKLFKQGETEESVLGRFSTEVSTTFQKKLGGEEHVEVRRIDMVGAKVGSDLKQAGILSMLFALVLILIYIWFRFEYKFAPGAVVALVHDVTITLGAFSFLQKEFNLTILAALLAIIGYSLNDTIVVFDRIRENIIVRSGEHFFQIINKSINETLSRTILTSSTTLFVVVALFIYGGGVIHDFAFTLLIGIVVGTYSSIFIASPVLLWLHNREAQKTKK
ncbi:MAG: protein translocase subunit SecF [Deltaproteobacteria bacterium]|nr:protein translocase subunit SecF [Deltaproteobacteria bacterium]